MKIALVALLTYSAITPMCFAQDILQKLTIEGAAGPTFPAGSARSRLNTGYNFLLGAGWKFSPHFSGLLEFQHDRFSLTTGALQAFNQPDGFNSFSSLTFNPRYYFRSRGKLGGYGTAGYGIYGRTLAFTDPSQAVDYCDPYYGCSSSGAPIISSATNYKGGFNAGGGFTYALGDTGLRLVADVRYNRFLSHANNEFVTLSFGIVF